MGINLTTLTSCCNNATETDELNVSSQKKDEPIKHRVKKGTLHKSSSEPEVPE